MSGICRSTSRHPRARGLAGAAGTRRPTAPSRPSYPPSCNTRPIAVRKRSSSSTAKTVATGPSVMNGGILTQCHDGGNTSPGAGISAPPATQGRADDQHGRHVYRVRNRRCWRPACHPERVADASCRLRRASPRVPCPRCHRLRGARRLHQEPECRRRGAGDHAGRLGPGRPETRQRHLSERSASARWPTTRSTAPAPSTAAARSRSPSRRPTTPATSPGRSPGRTACSTSPRWKPRSSPA